MKLCVSFTNFRVGMLAEQAAELAWASGAPGPALFLCWPLCCLFSKTRAELLLSFSFLNVPNVQKFIGDVSSWFPGCAGLRPLCFRCCWMWYELQGDYKSFRAWKSFAQVLMLSLRIQYIAHLCRGSDFPWFDGLIVDLLTLSWRFFSSPHTDTHSGSIVRKTQRAE